MTRLNVRWWYGFAGGLLAALAVVAAMGAGTTPPNATPRYSTQSLVLPGMMSFLLVVTDNQTNKLYLYSPVEKAKEPEFKLGFTIDLSQAGQTVMKGEAAEKPKESPAKTPAK